MRDLRPPNEPWIPLTSNPCSKAALDWYYSDSNTKVPIRDVSHPTDPKADPNFETQTFGLFSTCNKKMRKSIVQNGISTIFFSTTRKNSVRVLTGYYEVGWYYEVEPGDYMIAARKSRFINPGFRLDDLKEYLGGYPINKFFRSFRYIDKEQAIELRKLLDVTPDTSSLYLKEVVRLSSLQDKFSWNDVAKMMRISKQESG